MGVKILSQAGNSLADIYDVVGSSAGIDELETHELGIIHEMGATVFSERFSGSIDRLATAALLQNVNFDLTLQRTSPIIRILGVSVFSDVGARVAFASLAVRSRATEREVPIWAWDVTPDIDMNIRIDDNGTGAANINLLRPVQLLENLPTMLMTIGQPLAVSDIVFRGRTGGFGAGTVALRAVIHTGFAQTLGISVSRGLPVPSW